MAIEETKTNTATIQEKAKPKQVKPTVEKQTNCLGCGKPIKKIKRYYRDGKFYCNKRCWRKSISPKETK